MVGSPLVPSDVRLASVVVLLRIAPPFFFAQALSLRILIALSHVPDPPIQMRPVARGRIGSAKRPSCLACTRHGEFGGRSGTCRVDFAHRLTDCGILAQLRKTCLYDFHVSNGAKMVPFAGYSMPLSYGNVGAGASRLSAYHPSWNSCSLL